jgi:hypothetical protein
MAWHGMAWHGMAWWGKIEFRLRLAFLGFFFAATKLKMLLPFIRMRISKIINYIISLKYMAGQLCV